MNKNLIFALLFAGSANAIRKPFKLDGTLIDFDETEVAEPVDFKKKFDDDMELLKTSVKEAEHAQENMEMGSLNKELAVGLVEDIKKNLMDVTHHIEQDLSVDQDVDSSADSQGKLNMAELEKELHSMSEDGEKMQKDNARARAQMIKDLIPTTNELEQKLSMLPEGTYNDKDLDGLENKMDKILGQVSDKKTEKSSKKSTKKVTKKKAKK